MITEETKSLNDLTDMEYKHLVDLGNEVRDCRSLMSTPRGMMFIGAYTDAESAFYAACDFYNADPSEMFFELA
jgi:hypothetical protein